LRASSHNFLAVGEIAPMESAPMSIIGIHGISTMFPTYSKQVICASLYRLVMCKAQYTPPTLTRRNCFFASRRRWRCVHEFATTADGFERTTQLSAASLQFWSRLPMGVFTPTTRRNCRQLVANSCTHCRRDATRQFRLLGVGGVYWA